MLWVNNVINSQLNNNLELITDFANWKVVISFILALLVSIFIIWWGDSTWAYISLFTSYIIIANIAYSWDWPLIWFPLCYLLSLIIFNCFVLIKQFLSADAKKINRKYLLIFLGLYGLTVCLFAINEFIPNNSLKHLLQPYGVKQRFFILADSLEKKLSNFVIDLQSFWCKFNLAYPEIIRNSLVDERPNSFILEVRVKDKAGIVKEGCGLRSGSAVVINSEITSSSNITAVKRYVIAQNRAFVGEQHSFGISATKFTEVDSDINIVQELQKVERDFKDGKDSVGPGTLSRYLSPSISAALNLSALTPTLRNEHRAILLAPHFSQNSLFSNYREIFTATTNNQINNVNSTTLFTQLESYNEDFIRAYNSSCNYPVLKDEFNHIPISELEQILENSKVGDFKIGWTIANLQHGPSMGGHYAYVLFSQDQKRALAILLTTSLFNNLEQTTFNNKVLDTISNKILRDNGIDKNGVVATLPGIKNLINPTSRSWLKKLTPADGFKQRVAPTLLVVETEILNKFISFDRIDPSTLINAKVNLINEHDHVLMVFKNFLTYSVDTKNGMVKTLTINKINNNGCS